MSKTQWKKGSFPIFDDHWIETSSCRTISPCIWKYKSFTVGAPCILSTTLIWSPPKNSQFWPGLRCWRMEQQPNDRANCPGTAGLSPNKSPLCHGCFGFRMSIIVWVLMAIFAYPLSWHPWVMPTLCSIVWDLGVSIVPIMNMLLESTRFICMNWILLIHREVSFQAQSVRSHLRFEVSWQETFQDGAKKFDSGGRLNPILLPMVSRALQQARRVRDIWNQYDMQILQICISYQQNYDIAKW